MKKVISMLNDKKITDSVLSDSKQIIDFAFLEIVRLPESPSSFEKNAFSMMHKLLHHAISLTSLSSGTIIQFKEKKRIIQDKDSILVLMRTIFENYLTFSAIYMFPKTAEEKLFRHDLYCYVEKKVAYERLKEINSNSSFRKMSDLIKTFTEADILNQQNFIKSEVDYYEQLVLKNEIYHTLSANQLKIVNGKPRPSWKIDGSWYVLAKLAKFNMANFRYSYNMLSSSVHTGSQSIGVFNVNNELDELYTALTLSTLMNLTVIVSRAILEYCDFTKIKSTLKNNQDILEKMKKRVVAGMSVCIFEEDKELIDYINNY